ncbi:MAG: transporter substrate-binding domain-containing protein [Rhodospirillales bacterium]|nr:transporter substrate-binding domain-containing protein [Rhodospirillales bacterium]
MKRISGFLLFVFVLFVTSYSLAEDKAFERIQKKQEINCGVYVLGSIFGYGPDGKPTGFTADLFDEIALRTGMKVKYTEISSFATMFEDMKVGHYDMICSPLLSFPSTMMKGLPGTFIAEDPINIYADIGADLSGITALDQLNDPQYTFVGMDGELGGIYVPKLFPKAKLNMLPMGVPPSNMFMDVQTKKADFVVLSSLAAKAYEQANPGTLQQVTDKSLVPASVRLFFAEDSENLRVNINVVMEEMKRDGTLDRLLAKHGLKD